MTEWSPDLTGIAKGMHKEVRCLLRRLQEQGGWVGRRTTGNHLRLRHEESGGAVTIPGTPSDCRSLKNTERDLRRALGEGS